MHEPFFRRRPPLARQGGFLSCWAAALVSWLRVTYPEVELNERGIVDLFTPYCGEGERLLWPGLEAVARHFSMDWAEFGPGKLTPEIVAARLTSGHLYLTYVPCSNARVAAHTVVVWGVGDATVEVMDPFEGYVSRPLEFLQSRTRAFVGWPSVRRFSGR
jgi:hypothetical protein